MTHTAEKPMNTYRLFRRNSLSSVAAPTYTYATLTSSEGWNEKPQNSSQLRAPSTTSLATTLMPSSARAASAMGIRARAVRCSERCHQPNSRNSASPASVSRICLYRSSGVEDAATDMPSELR